MSQNHPLLIDIGQGLSLMTGLPTILTWDNKTRPASPKKGTLGYNSKTGNLEFWDGSSWMAAPMNEGKS